jgi:putative DNA primase/helicase
MLFPERIPSVLQTIPQWVVWRTEFRDGKPTKVPYQPNGRRASSTERATWTTFETALASSFPRDGIGFVFTADDPFCGVDLDEKMPAADRARIVEELDSYTEVSPSGSGAHVIVRASMDGLHGHRRGPVEIYDRRRFFTVTGCVFDGHDEIHDRQAQLEAIHAREIAPLRPTNSFSPGEVIPKVVDLNDEELLERARAARNGDAFERLWSGDTSGYSSASEADLALVSHLVFWTGSDATRVDSLFRQSGLYREKWERPDYRERTIAKALEGGGDVYSASTPSGRTVLTPSKGIVLRKRDAG